MSKLLKGVVTDEAGQPILAARIAQNGLENTLPVFTNNAGEFELLTDEAGKRSVNISADGYKEKNVMYYNNGKVQEFELKGEKLNDAQAIKQLADELKKASTPAAPTPTKQAHVIPIETPTKTKRKPKRDILEYILIALSVIMVLVAIYVFYKLFFSKNSKPSNSNSLPQVNESKSSVNAASNANIQASAHATPTPHVTATPSVNSSSSVSLPIKTPKVIKI